jgi:hypothetical protein
MTSLFAPQFNYTGTYELPGLSATPNKINLKLPDRGPKTPKDPTPEETPTSNPETPGTPNSADVSGTLGLSGGKQARLNSMIGMGASNSMAASNTKANEMPVSANASPASPSYVSMNKFYDALPGSTPPEVSIPKPSTVSTGGGGFSWGGLGHDIASGFDTTRHAVASGADAVNNVAQNHYVKDVMSFGDPLHSQGIAGITSPSKVATPPLEGTVLPKAAPTGVSQGASRVIQGSVEPSEYSAPGSLGSGSNAIGPGSYSSQFKGQGFGRDMIARSQQASAKAAANSSDLWSELSGDAGSAASDLGSVAGDLASAL